MGPWAGVVVAVSKTRYQQRSPKLIYYLSMGAKSVASGYNTHSHTHIHICVHMLYANNTI